MPVYAGSLVVTSVFVGSYEPRLDNSVGSPVSVLDPSVSYNFFSSSYARLPELQLMFDCESAPVSSSFWMKCLW